MKSPADTTPSPDLTDALGDNIQPSSVIVNQTGSFRITKGPSPVRNPGSFLILRLLLPAWLLSTAVLMVQAPFARALLLLHPLSHTRQQGAAFPLVW